MENQLSDQRKLAQTANWNRDEQALATCKKIDKWVGYLPTIVGDSSLKQLNVRMEDDDYERLKETKGEDETWYEWLLRSAEMREENIETEVN